MKMTKRERNRLAQSALPADTPIEDAVARWLSLQPQLRYVRLPHCAEALGFTEYGLRDRLLARGNTYQDLLDMERIGRLEALMDYRPRTDGEQAAAALGFSCGDVFRKWYRRHYGTTWKDREIG